MESQIPSLSGPDRMPEVVARGNPTLPEVALTFDDGPGPYTSQVLQHLEEYGALATFFTIGQQVAQQAGLVQKQLQAGHAVANHSFTHPHLPSLSSFALLQELSETQEVLRAVGGERPALFRPPYGAYDERVLAAAGQLKLTVVIWSASSEDWTNPQPAPEEIAARVLDAAENGAIFLMHDGGGDRRNTVAALPLILRGLQERGLRPVTLPHMLAHLAG